MRVRPPRANEKPYVQRQTIVVLTVAGQVGVFVCERVGRGDRAPSAQRRHEQHQGEPSPHRSADHYVRLQRDTHGTRARFPAGVRSRYGYRYRKRVHADRRRGPAGHANAVTQSGTPADTAGEPQT